MATRVRSFSKINLGLRIGPVRPDGYHALATVYQTLGLCDVLEVEARRAAATRIVLRTDHPWVPTDARNTVWKMVERALEALGVTAEVEVRLEKRLPVQGGMGAGSANAAAALVGLERELGLEAGEAGGLSGAERLRVAAAVGSDVPLFLLGGSVLGLGRGEQVIALPDLDGAQAVSVVVAIPRLGVSTPAAFREWDRRVLEQNEALALNQGLTRTDSPSTLKELSLAASAAFARSELQWASRNHGGVGTPSETAEMQSFANSPLGALLSAGIENDFEEVVFGIHPALRTLKAELLGAQTVQPAMYAAMSGSGSTLFGLYATEKAAEAAEARIHEVEHEFGVETRRTVLLSRRQMWATTFC